jgi:hypothetical protein
VNSIFMIRPFNLMPPFMPPLVTTEDLSKRKKKKK